MRYLFFYGLMVLILTRYVYIGIMFYKIRNKEYVSEAYNILMRNLKMKNPEKILKFYGLFHFIIATLGIILFFIIDLVVIALFVWVLALLEDIFFIIISKKSEKIKHIISLVSIVIILLFEIKSLDTHETTKNIYNISYTIVIENGLSDFKELKEKSILEEIFKSEIKNISKMRDKKIELYDQKGKLLIKSDLYEAEVKNSATNEYEKIENIIKYKGKYYKIYEPKKFD
ncbi:hypothetical protein [Parvimonas sp. G1425]|uniref:hypothetical protein n=1 Tax=Parvimonas sp. G1425 TaxID=3387694 RepID=UPI0039E4244B